MISIPFAPSDQPAWRGLIRPMLLISIALHGLLFFVPTPSAPEAPPEETEEKVSLTQLPSATSPVATPAARPTPTPARPTPAAVPPVQRIPPRSNPVPPVPPTITRPVTPPAPRPAQAPPPATATSTPTTAPAAATATPSPAPSAPPATDPFVQGFPTYPNAQQGSFDGLPPAFATNGFRTDDSLVTVASFFETQLASAGYSATEVSSNNNNEQRIYEVSRNGETQYLTLLANPRGAGTTYVLSREKSENIADANLQDPAQSELFADLGGIISQTGSDGFTNRWQDINPVVDPVSTLLNSPESFFTSVGTQEANLRVGVLQAQTISDSSQTVMDALRPLLEQNGISIAPDQDYGGGLTYQVSREAPGRGSVTAYLVLVPTTDNRTMLALWDRPPS